MSQQEKNNPADVQRAALSLAASIVNEFESLVSSFAAGAPPPTHVWPVDTRLRLRHKTFVWASGGPVGVE
jgi:hypothetical protein